MQTRAQLGLPWKQTGWRDHLEDLSLRVALLKHCLAVPISLQLEIWVSTLVVAASTPQLFPCATYHFLCIIGVALGKQMSAAESN